ncbi:MAG: hypothetical protein ACFBSC_01575 [Microcoleaceae cyanobacterium]
MKPRIKDQIAWQQAELLMQPALIRILDNLRKELEESPWAGTYQEVQSPYPGYQLDLTLNSQTISVDVWELCYRVCFKNYHSKDDQSDSQENSQAVEIDTDLIDETGDVDWNKLEEKSRHVIKQLFDSLPT